MNFKDELLKLSERIARQKSQIMTEEATKTAFVLPFLQALGYDVFDPFEVEPEHTCDVGTKKGEKVDYAIKRDNKPILLMECKHWEENLDLHGNQLFRYYVTSAARFAVLTNGIIYRFFSDSEKPNIMDSRPFLEVDITDINEYQIEQLRKFHKQHLDEQFICATIPSIRYVHSAIALSIAEKTRLKEKNARLHVNYEAASTEISRLRSLLDLKQREFDERLERQLEISAQKISELETALKNITELALTNPITGEEDELDSLIDYLNMPVPDNWYKKTTLAQRRHYWNNEKSNWIGRPRSMVCTTEIAFEFYNFDPENYNPAMGRKIGKTIRQTGLFIQSDGKKHFGEYGVLTAWVRKKALIKSAKLH